MKTFQTFQNFGAALVALIALTTIPSASAQVTITNPDTQPVPIKDVQPPGTQPFQYEFNVNMPAGQLSSDSQDIGQKGLVTITRVFVLEHVGFLGSCSGGASQNVAFGLHVYSPNLKPPSTQDVKIYAGKASGPFLVTADSGDIYGAAPMRLYLPLGTTFSGIAFRDGQKGQCAGTVSVSGYVERVPF